MNDKESTEIKVTNISSSDANNINPPKKENPLSLWSYVLNFPEAFECFLARPSMCSIWICSQAIYS